MWSNIIRGGGGSDNSDDDSDVYDDDDQQQDGWGDDDNVGSDNDNNDYYFKETDQGVQQQQQQQQKGDDKNDEQQQHGDDNNRPPAVRSLFMGRLTRFLDQVTQPDDSTNHTDDQHDQQLLQHDQQRAAAARAQQPAASPAVVADELGWAEGDTSLGLDHHSMNNNANEDGWGDEVNDNDLLDLDDDDQQQPQKLENQQRPSPSLLPSPDEQHAPSQQQQQSQRDGTDFEDATEGWGDDNLGLDDDDNESPTQQIRMASNNVDNSISSPPAQQHHQNNNNGWNGAQLDVSEVPVAEHSWTNNHSSSSNDVVSHIGDVDVSTAASQEQFAQAEAQLDNVISTILHQEEEEEGSSSHHNTDHHAGMLLQRHVSDGGGGGDDLAEDERHQNQAVAEIQKELESVHGLLDVVVVTNVVDTLPKEEESSSDNNNPNNNDPSVRAVGGDDFYSQVSVVDGNNNNNIGGQGSDLYDEEDNESRYGPVVNHTPHDDDYNNNNNNVDIPLERQASMAVQLMDSDDFDDDDDDDLSVGDGWDDEDEQDEDDLSLSNNNNNDDNNITPLEPALVDHTPSVATAPKNTDPSVGVLASETGSTVGDMMMMMEAGADDDSGSAGKDNIMVHPMDSKRELFGPVVDHTPPQVAPTSGPTTAIAAAQSPSLSGLNSLAVHAQDIEDDFKNDEAMDETVTMMFDDNNGDLEDAWGDDDDLDFNDDDDDDEVEKGSNDHHDDIGKAKITLVPLTGASLQQQQQQDVMVDHTPSEMMDTASTIGNTTADPSIVALATVEDLTRVTGNDGDDGVDVDDEIYGDDENETAFGPVVDHTPVAPPQAISGENSLAVNVNEDEDDDDDDDDDQFGDSVIEEEETETIDQKQNSGMPSSADDNVTSTHLVDHTPEEMGSPSDKQVADPSMAVLASVRVNSGDDGEFSANESYGPVVDLTPTTPMPAARSDSIVVQAQDLDTVDGTLSGGSRGGAGDDNSAGEASSTNNEDDEIDDEKPAALRSLEDKLVDHVPQRPESRFGDASTLVAAEPSEILSEGDDMAQQNYGPVVDLTPTVGGHGGVDQPSRAGSTVVFAPQSIAEDDLEVADETNGEENGWDGAVAEETPNPQSGNDEPEDQPEEEQQLVDFLPLRDNVAEIGGLASSKSEDSSEVAVGGAQSLTLQAEDPKEDDFGPVVDLTPTVRSLRASGVSIASVATQVTASECRALEKEDNAQGEGENEDTDNEKSKVVVDALPSQIRAKRQMDSIGTVGQSQLTADEEEDNESAGYGPVVDQLPTSRASLAPSRGGSTVDALATVSEVDSDDEDGDGWGDDVDLDLSVGGISDKVQRPSIQRSSRQSPANENDRSVSVRFEASIEKEIRAHPDILETESQELGWGDDIDLSGIDSQSVPFDKQLSEADTPPSTPYRRTAGKTGSLEGLEGLSLPMKFRSDVAQELKEASPETIHALEQEYADLRNESSYAQRKLEEASARIRSLEGEKAAWEIKQQSLESQLHDPSAGRTIDTEDKSVESLHKELTAKSEICSTFENEVAVLRREIEDLKRENTSMSAELEQERHRALEAEKLAQGVQDQTCAQREEERISREKLFEAKVAVETELAAANSRFDDELKEMTTTIERQKVDIRLLQSNVGALESQAQSQAIHLSKQRSLAGESESLANELVSVAKERDLLQEAYAESKEAISSLQSLIDDYGSKSNDNVLKKEAQIVALSIELEGTKTRLTNCEHALFERDSQIKDLIEHNGLLAKQVDEATVELDAQKIRMEGMEQTASEMDSLLENRHQELERISSRCDDLKLYNEELDKSYRSLQMKSAQSEKDTSVLVSERDAANAQLARLDSELRAAHDACNQLQDDKNMAQAELAKCKNDLQSFEKELAETTQDYAEKLDSQAKIHVAELDNLKHSLSADENRRAEEFESRSKELRKLQHETELLRKQTVEKAGEMELVKNHLSRANEQIQTIEGQLDQVQAERDSTISENEEILVQLSLFHQNIQDNEEEIIALRAELENAERSTQNALEVESRRNVELDSKNNEVSNDLKGLNFQLSELQSKLTMKDTEISRVYESLKGKEEHEETLNVALTEAKADLKEARSLLEEKAREVSRLERQLEDAQDDLNMSREQLDAAEASVRAGEQLSTFASTLQEIESSEKQTIQELQSEVSEKTNTVGSLEKHIEQLRGGLHESNEKLQTVAKEMQVLKEQLSRRNKEAESLKQVLSETTTRLTDKEAELVRLNSCSNSHSNGIVSGNDEDLGSLKSHVMSLAVALERSETRRAESIDRLVREREASAESLRRLGESVKRFYSAVSFGDK